MKNISIKLFARIILGGIFIYAGLYKLSDPTIFERSLINYSLFSSVLTHYITVVFPYVLIV